jgi:hypothetical protein
MLDRSTSAFMPLTGCCQGCSLNNRGQITGWGTDFTVEPDIAVYTWIFQD